MRISSKKSISLLKRVCIIGVIFISIFFLTGCEKYKNVKSIDLSNESINGISLMKKYNSIAAEKAFGKCTKVVDHEEGPGYTFDSEEIGSGLIEIDENNNITLVYGANTQKSSLITKKGITTNKSSFDDIVKAYGNNYLKEIQEDANHGSCDPNHISYTITYIDKKNNYGLEFSIIQEKITRMRLWKYQ